MRTVRLGIAAALALLALAMGLPAMSGADAAARAPRCLGLAATVVAPPSGGTIEGTAGDDVIYGSNRADTIFGNGGNDTICGGGGNDIIYAYAPNGTVETDACVDSVDSEDAYTTKIDGGSGDDLICGPNSVYGGYWNVKGGSGNDVIGHAQGVDEDIDGGSGSDTIVGAAKYPGDVNTFSRVTGGSGSDTVNAGEMFFYPDNAVTPFEVVADGGSGNDDVHGAAVDQLSGTLIGGSGVDTCTMAIGTGAVLLEFDPSCEVQTT